MPELPEAERARQTLETVLGKRIARVEDSDSYVCRPHAPGEIDSALAGRKLTAANRRGKFIWAETEGGPDLGLHLGMAGHLVLGDPPEKNPAWDRFAIEFEDGTRLALRDRRRLGRAVVDPDWSHVGPDAFEVSREDFRARVATGSAPLKARLMDQSAIAGVGNLLADEILWQARLSPLTPAGELGAAGADALRRQVRAAIRSALRRGGAHTGDLIEHRVRDGICPRCGTPLARATVGGRTTYWCPECQP